MENIRSIACGSIPFLLDKGSWVNAELQPMYDTTRVSSSVDNTNIDIQRSGRVGRER